jgi:hypothetical protein
MFPNSVCATLQGVQDQIAWLTAELDGLTNKEECLEALNASGGDVPSAARYIKLNKLLK